MIEIFVNFIHFVWSVFVFIVGIAALILYMFSCAFSVSILNVRNNKDRYLLFAICLFVTPILFTPISIWLYDLIEKRKENNIS